MSKTSILIDVKNILETSKHAKLLSKVGKIPERDASVGLILVISKSEKKKLEGLSAGSERISYITSPQFVSSISGSCYTSYDKRKEVCEILEPDGTIIKYVVDTLLKELPATTTLWLRVRLNLQGFEKQVKSALMSGFSNPYLCVKSPQGDIKSESLCLYRKNTRTVRTDITKARKGVNHILSQKKNKVCKLKIRISPKAADIMSDLCTNGKTVKKEIAGSLQLSMTDDGVFSVNIIENGLVNGSAEGVDVAESRYNFHTHPKSAYDRHKVENGWPSSQDYLGFFDAMKQYDTSFHIVSTLEGVYIISMCEKWLGKYIDDPKDFILDNYDHFKENISRVEYVKKINNVKYKGQQLFCVTYAPWKAVKKGKIFNISYPKTVDSVGQNCFVGDENIKGYYRINK